MTDNDAAILHGEVAALQAVLISVLRKLSAELRDMTKDFCAACDEAETILTGLALRLGPEPASLTSITALRVLEEIRGGVLERGDCR